MPLTLPPPARLGEIRVIAPAAALSEPAKAQLKEGIKTIEGQGYAVSVDPGVYVRDHYFAGDMPVRQRGLAAALRAPEVSTLWAARGGYGTAEALEHLTPEDLRKRPKWLVGYSDLTAAHVLWQQAGLVSLHAVMATALTRWTPAARDELFALLDHPETCQQTLKGKVLARPNGVSSVGGVLWGGNLTVLASLVGTTPLPPIAAGPTVLFLEDTDSSYRNHRCVYQLLRGGAMANVVGVLLGQWSDVDAPAADAPINPDTQAVAKLLASHGLPVLGNLPVGHAPSSRALLMGGQATIDLEAGVLQVSTQPSNPPAHSPLTSN